VEPDSYELIQVAEFQVVEGHVPAKVTSRIDVIDGCFAVYCNAVGEAVFRQLMSHGIRAIRVESGTPITDLLHQLQEQWPQRIPQKTARTTSADKLVDALEEAGWDE
jgi:nitrogen fixation protein NifX